MLGFRAVGVFLAGLLFAGAAMAAEVRISHDGLTLNGNQVLAEGKAPADGMVLLVHGLLAHRGMEIIATQQQLLAERGISSLAINLGLAVDDRQGAIDCAKPHRHLDSRAPGEIAAWVKWLTSRGVARITVVGHSRGGANVARYATEYDQPNVAELILVAPATWSADRAAKGYQRRYKADLVALLARAEAMVAMGQGDALMKKVGFLYCPDADVAASTFVDYYRGGPEYDTPSLLPKIGKPVLVVAATEDQVIRDLAGRVAPMADGERLQLVEIDGAGHFFLDLYAEDLADAIAEFIQR